MGRRRHRASGRGWRRKCEELLAIDIRQLRAIRRLCAGAAFTLQWSRAGESLGAVHITVDARGLEVSYGARQHKIEQRIDFTWTQCRFGGRRRWFACPNCARRCAILYGIDRTGRFSCRLCMGLAYSSESEGANDRQWRKQLKLEARLDNDGGKPKWIRWRTYSRICANIEALEDERASHVFDSLRTRRGD
jgi:hypothetical protein